jgi:transposase
MSRVPRAPFTKTESRRALRSGLYIAALAAARYNSILSRFYQHLRDKGKPHQLALTAVMRKLLLALNHTLKPRACTT